MRDHYTTNSRQIFIYSVFLTQQIKKSNLQDTLKKHKLRQNKSLNSGVLNQQISKTNITHRGGHSASSSSFLILTDDIRDLLGSARLSRRFAFLATKQVEPGGTRQSVIYRSCMEKSVSFEPRAGRVSPRQFLFKTDENFTVV